MNKSLLVTLAIMPALLASCKSNKLERVIFEDATIEFEEVNEQESIIGSTKPATPGLTFTWAPIAGKSYDWESWFTIKQNESNEQGDYQFTFTCIKEFTEEVLLNCLYENKPYETITVIYREK